MTNRGAWSMNGSCRCVIGLLAAVYALAVSCVGAADASGGDGEGARLPTKAQGPQARERALAYLERAQAAAAEIEDEEKRLYHKHMVAVYRARAGDDAGACEAVMVVADEVERDGWLMRIAQVQAEAGKFKSARETAETIEGESARSRVYRRIAVAEAEAGQVEDAIVTATYIADDAFQDHAYTAIAVAKARAGAYEAALKTADGLLSAEDQYAAYREIAHVMIEARQRDKTRRALERASERVGKIEITSQRIAALEALAKLWEEVEELEVSERLLEEAAELILDGRDALWGGVPRGITIAVMLHERGQEDLAHRTLRYLSLRLQAESHAVQWDLGRTVRAQKGIGDFEGAYATVDGWNEASRAHISAEAIAQAQVEAGDHGGAREAAALRDDLDPAFVEMLVVRARARGGELEAARQLAATIDEQRYRVLARTHIAVGYGMLGDMEAVAAILDELEPDASSPVTIADTCLELAQVRLDADDRESAAAMIERALRHVDRIERPSERMRYYRRAASSWHAIGEGARAEAALDQAVEAAALIEQPFAALGGFQEVAEIYRQLGEGDAVRQTLRRASERVGRFENPDIVVVEAALLVRAQIEAGDAMGARQTAELVEQPASRFDFYHDVAAAFSRAGDTEAVAALYGDADEPLGRALVMLGAADGLLEPSTEHARLLIPLQRLDW